MRDDRRTDEALERLADCGPDLRNGLTSHAPMVVEALAELGRSDAVLPWLDRYRAGMLPRPHSREPIAPDAWATALGREDRFADWTAFFERELAASSWRDVLARWLPRLAPAVCASAAHGVIRVGHAARSLSHAETAPRIEELASGLAYWAAAYQTLPTAPEGRGGGRARDAIARVAIVPPAERRFAGTIVSALVGLDHFPPFADTIHLLDVADDPPAVVSDVTETFARVFLANARDTLGAIVFVHAVTSAAALRSLFPYVDTEVARTATRYAWQTAAALYATFGSAPAAADPIEPPRESPEDLVDRAIAHGDDHAIKFTEACLREHAISPAPAFLAAARRSLDLLVPA